MLVAVVRFLIDIVKQGMSIDFLEYFVLVLLCLDFGTQMYAQIQAEFNSRTSIPSAFAAKVIGISIGSAVLLLAASFVSHAWAGALIIVTEILLGQSTAVSLWHHAEAIRVSCRWLTKVSTVVLFVGSVIAALFSVVEGEHAPSWLHAIQAGCLLPLTLMEFYFHRLHLGATHHAAAEEKIDEDAAAPSQSINAHQDHGTSYQNLG